MKNLSEKEQIKSRIEMEFEVVDNKEKEQYEDNKQYSKNNDMNVSSNNEYVVDVSILYKYKEMAVWSDSI